MSFIVEYLILNGLQIKETHDLESDEYNDLLLIEKTLEDLRENRRITVEEQFVMEVMADTGNYREASKTTGILRDRLADTFEGVCERIAYLLGGYFTNEGYLEHIKNKYHLFDYQIEELRKILNSRERYNMTRRIT